uniref:Transmembrane protein n=1 Tax=Nelumbo nucifera TaxID=4432 RepID=A0A822XX72_NELNU|nr:TPA_asm: hypothetical protein HUJ06_026076 [Nelumbo nucifera]
MKESIERERERERERRCYCCCIHCKKGRTKRKGGAVIAAAFKSEILKPKNLLAEQRRERKRRVGYQWIIRFLALGCYAMLLIPSFIQVGYYYFFSSQVHRGIVYGDQPRNRLDLYLPKNSNGKNQLWHL